MNTITPNQLDQERPFSLRFSRRGDDILLAVGAREVSLRATYRELRQRYPRRFRGAITYSEEAFRHNLRETSTVLTRHFAEHRVHWAVKSAPIQGLVNIAAQEGAAFDVGSSEELLMARRAGADGGRIYHTAPAKFDWDIEAIVEHNCVPISDNLTELRLVDRKAGERGRRIVAGIRINPAVGSSTQREISTGSLDCKFGLPDISGDVLAALKGLGNLDIRVLHMHIGSQISDPADYSRALESMLRVYSLFLQRGFHIDTLDIGGGYPYRYLDHPEAADGAGAEARGYSNYAASDFETYMSEVEAVLRDTLGDQVPRIAIEPGRHVAAGTAFALGYVLNTKLYPNGIRWVMSSISVNDLFHKELVPAAYFDVHVVKESSGRTVPSALGGTLCFSGDILTPWGAAVEMEENIERGDILLFDGVGAYSLLGSGNFHNMPRLPLLMIDAGLDLVELRPQEEPYFEARE